MGQVYTKVSLFKMHITVDRCNGVYKANNMAKLKMKVAVVAQPALFRYLRIMT